MNRTTVFLPVAFSVILFAILSMDATYDRHIGNIYLKLLLYKL